MLKNFHEMFGLMLIAVLSLSDGLFTNFYFRPLRIQVKTILPAFLAVLFWQLFLNLMAN